MLRIAVLLALPGCANDTPLGLLPPACTIARVFDELPPCPETAGDGRIDIANGCADEGCVGMTAPQLEAVWGEAPTCGRPSAGGSLYCAWPAGFAAHFDDADHDGVPDPDSAVGTLYIEAPYDGTTPEGLGPGAPQSCFFRAMGDPDVVTAVDDDAGYTFRSLRWTGDGVTIYDPRGDGVASLLALAGAR